MTSCEDVLDLLPEVLPRLTPHAISVHEHLRSCVECGEAAEELTRVLHALETEGAPTPALSEGFADRVVDALPAKGGVVRRLLPASALGWVALAACGMMTLSVIGIRHYVDGIRLQHQVELVDCYVAARDLQPGKTITPDDVVEAQFPQRVLQGYGNSRINDKTTIIGARLKEPVDAGQVLQTYHFHVWDGRSWRSRAIDPIVVDDGADESPLGVTHAAPVPPRPPREAVTAVAPTAPQPPSIQVAGGSNRRAAPTSAARYYAAAEAAGGDTTLVRYVTDAGLVLEAVAVLDEPDPHWLRVLARRVDEADLLERGERLLVELRRDPDQGELRPLISATQLVLRKVRHAPADEPELALVTLRREVSSTGLLEAYRALLAPARPTQPTPPAAGGGPF